MESYNSIKVTTVKNGYIIKLNEYASIGEIRGTWIEETPEAVQNRVAELMTMLYPVGAKSSDDK